MLRQSPRRTTGEPRFLEPDSPGDLASATQLLLVRHAEAEPYGGTATGSWDPPLTARGERQARRLARRLRQEGPIDRIYTSPLQCAWQTAAVLALELVRPFLDIYDLREIAWRGHAADASAPAAGELFEDALTRLRLNGHLDSCPVAEPGPLFRTRVRYAVDGICASNPGRRVVAITHGWVINAYLAELFGAQQHVLCFPRHTSITSIQVIRHDVRFLDRLNDACHLDSFACDYEEDRNDTEQQYCP